MPRIPRLLHQIWIGPDPQPAELIASWRDQHPGWVHRLWTPDSLDEMDWRGGSRRIYDRYVTERCWHGAANVARVEILRRAGGVYLDADMECLHPLDGAPFLDAGFWVSESPHKKDRPQNAAMGCIPGHPLIEVYSLALSRVRKLRPAWRCTGALVLQRLMTELRSVEDVELVPSPAFHPQRADGRPNRTGYAGPVYADHQFYSTRRHRTSHA